MKKNRWYDKHEGLANHLEALKTMPKRQLNELLKDLIAFARLFHPTLFEDHLFEYPLDPKRRRWYDDDPYLWLVVNGLRFTDDEVIQRVVAFFDKQIGLTPKASKKTVAKKPVVVKTAAKKPVVKKVTTKKSTVKKAAVKKPVAKKAVTKKSVVKKSAVKKPVAGQFKAKKAAVKKTIAQPETGKPALKVKLKSKATAKSLKKAVRLRKK